MFISRESVSISRAGRGSILFTATTAVVAGATPTRPPGEHTISSLRAACSPSISYFASVPHGWMRRRKAPLKVLWSERERRGTTFVGESIDQIGVQANLALLQFSQSALARRII